MHIIFVSEMEIERGDIGCGVVHEIQCCLETKELSSAINICHSFHANKVN